MVFRRPFTFYTLMNKAGRLSLQRMWQSAKIAFARPLLYHSLI
ncbi:hypothetical protein NEIMUCOT_04107 [Neisseria mucosa ATCC 25996]|uniref:Uncharacterized protein n=1 Tax=Neisseria mucosa (strain ATCC 25996 / DSM 4631 / NCTC 10774 / M26) TaxID=546266 RepID=D2ZU19_NEIM2|nr:hypothetical protein NEIMUCOT_04107 [Neisseria mucosa ATCC 25996]